MTPAPGRVGLVQLVVALAALVAAGLWLVACAAPPASGPSTATTPPAEIRVSAATSLRKVLEATAPRFEQAHGVKLIFNFGASGVLHKQIEAGAPADVFVSASPTQVESLIAVGHVSAEASSTFAGNDVVVFVPAGNPAGIAGPEDLAGAGKLVTGNPETAPHGTKAKEWLEAIGSWKALESRIVFAENAAQTLDYVARGEVDAGIGFASEALGSDAVEIVYTVPPGAIKPVRYVAAPLKAAEQPAAAAAYVEFLSSPAVQQALMEAGFVPAPER